MAIIRKDQLHYRYTWTAIPPDDARITGRPDSILLNRGEGYEVLAFLNRNCADLAGALKAERLIQTVVPGSVRSHANVFAWLKAHWHIYL